MRQKELRIALVCYGGVSLAVYMHGVTKELWKLACASRAYHAREPQADDSQRVYRALLEHLETRHGLRLRVLADIVAGASAGGINGVFLAQAIHSGQSLEPLTGLWLDKADVDVLLDPSAKPGWRFAKFWAAPLIWFALKRPGNVVAESVAPETRSEVRAKLSRLIRSRWFDAPFGGIGFSRLIADALDAMARTTGAAPLLPAGHPLDLFVTATDFKGHAETITLHSPARVEEPEHRVSIGFRAPTPAAPGGALANPLELVFAARATASFPGAFPALQVAELDRLAEERGRPWPGREPFLRRLLPGRDAEADFAGLALIDGSVLVNAPFAEAMGVLRDRPAQREVDRRFVYIDPHPDRVGGLRRDDPRPPSWFSVIFGSLSSIPREQPIRDNLDVLAIQSREMARLRSIVEALRPEVEEAVERLFGHTLFLDHPTVRRLAAWRDKAHEAARRQAGFTWHGYVELKFAGIVEALAANVVQAVPALTQETAAGALMDHLRRQGMGRLASSEGLVTPAAVAFLRAHDLSFRIRRLRLLARRLSEDWEDDPTIPEDARHAARDAIYRAMSLYFDKDGISALGDDFAAHAARVAEDPGAVLDLIAARRQLVAADMVADAILAEAMAVMPKPLRRKVLLTYLGFPYFDAVTLPLMRGEGLTEFDPVKVDRISPEDCLSIRAGGAQATLRGVEFYNFGAFFSRAYRENDYLWGRLHGAERMIDLVASALPPANALDEGEVRQFKRAAFLAILDEEEPRLRADPGLVPAIRREVEARMA
ncbi:MULTISPECIES: patatin-like protein [Novosphingobium]|uniref:Patatin-like protein n=1 Tax=Novosphingobium aerophilum TaxID=2839843 RepID=A0A7X1KC92_9SPHN|nr:MULTISPECIES: patatin-like protein [Novosphingobium]MBC2652071.1 patatin-like protein [Novosphingobium aerophilum]